MQTGARQIKSSKTRQSNSFALLVTEQRQKKNIHAELRFGVSISLKKKTNKIPKKHTLKPPMLILIIN